MPVLSSIKAVLNTIEYQLFRAKAQNTMLFPDICQMYTMLVQALCHKNTSNLRTLDFLSNFDGIGLALSQYGHGINMADSLDSSNLNFEYSSSLDNGVFFSDTSDLVFKPIGMHPYKVEKDLDDQIQRTYSALQDNQPTLNLNDYDIRPFNAQLEVNPVKKNVNTDTPFEADNMITFERGGKTHRVFIELDNRTEHSHTQIQKVLNYIRYALLRPEENILLAIVATDGSLPSPKIDGFSYPDKHLGTLLEKMLHVQIGHNQKRPDGSTKYAPYLKYSYYDRCPNLNIIFAGVSEAPMRIAEFIINANHNVEYINNAYDLAKRISSDTMWKVEFEPTMEVKEAIKNSRSFVDTQPYQLHYKVNGVYGYFNYTNSQTGLKLKQPIVAGDEYDFDTPDTVLRLTKDFDKQKALTSGQQVPPMVIFPTRERATHPIAIKGFRNRFNWSNKFTLGQPYYYQPRLGISDNPYLLRELRKLVNRYNKDIYNYFNYGYLTKSDMKKNVQYQQDHLNFKHDNLLKKPRKYEELHELTNYMNAKAFAEQVMLTEIPLGVFKALIERNQGLEFAIPVIAKLPYEQEGDTSLQVPNKVDLTDCLTTPNSLINNARYKINPHNFL